METNKPNKNGFVKLFIGSLFIKYEAAVDNRYCKNQSIIKLLLKTCGADLSTFNGLRFIYTLRIIL